MCSCLNELSDIEYELGVPIPGEVSILISASNLHQQVYTTYNEESLGLYVLYGDNELEKERYISNERHIFTNLGLIPENNIYYPVCKTKCTFLSYYPFSVDGIVEVKHTMKVNVNTDQTNLSFYNSSDFITSSITGVSPSAKEIPLAHEHRFSQLNIRIQCISNTNPESVRNLNPKVMINGTYTLADYDFNTHLLYNYRSKQSIAPYGQWVLNDKSLFGKKCILLPQIIPAGSTIATLIIGNKTFDCKLSFDYELESGKSHELTLVYDASIGFSEIITAINDWQQGENSSITAVNRPEKEYISINEYLDPSRFHNSSLT